jgi:hypothetical protein
LSFPAAKIAADGTLSVDYKLTDPKGLGLDRLGITTPGAISVSFLVTYIPKGQTLVRVMTVDEMQSRSEIRIRIAVPCCLPL